jgi:hypothetical protein
MEVIIKITNEELINLILHEKKINETQNKVIEEPVIKRGRGRPRVKPLPDPNAPKRKVGRPKKFKFNL